MRTVRRRSSASVDVERGQTNDCPNRCDFARLATVAHFGRHRPAHLETALALGAPPEFEGVTCIEERCDRRYGLEWDHVDPCANGGVTSLANLEPECKPHHRDKTRRDRSAGLLGPGRRARAP